MSPVLLRVSTLSVGSSPAAIATCQRLSADCTYEDRLLICSCTPRHAYKLVLLRDAPIPKTDRPTIVNIMRSVLSVPNCPLVMFSIMLATEMINEQIPPAKSQVLAPGKWV